MSNRKLVSTSSGVTNRRKTRFSATRITATVFNLSGMIDCG